MQDSWPHTLADGFIGACFGALLSVVVALYAIRRSQRRDRDNRREDLSLAAAERLTEALLQALRRLNQLSDHAVPRSQASRAELLATLVSELQTAVDLHAPVLSPTAFAQLPERANEALGLLVRAIGDREREVMRQERLTELDEDRAYPLDRQAAQLRQRLIAFLRGVTEALTGYRRGLPVPPDALPAIPHLPAVAPKTPARRAS